MIFWDVNLWLYIFRQDSPYHEQAKTVIEEDLKSAEGFLFSPHVAASFLRLVTNSAIFIQPSDYREAWEFIDHLETHPSSRYLQADDMVFGIFKHICLVNQVRGNEVPDAFLAAIALRYDSSFTTFDSGFKKYSGLNLRLLLPE